MLLQSPHWSHIPGNTATHLNDVTGFVQLQLHRHFVVGRIVWDRLEINDGNPVWGCAEGLQPDQSVAKVPRPKIDQMNCINGNQF